MENGTFQTPPPSYQQPEFEPSYQTSGPEIKPGREFAKGVFSVILEFIITIVIIFLVSFVIRMFILQPFVVEGQSMEPNFHNQEYLLAEKVTKYFKDYKRGDVIIFRSPSENFNLIKRIIALPGEKVTVEDGKIKIFKNPFAKDGIQMEEKYVLPDESQNQEPVEVTLKSDEYFVLGDNRTNSVDSRSFGPIKKDEIIGKVWLTAFPITNLEIFRAPEYNKSLVFFPNNLDLCTVEREFLS